MSIFLYHLIIASGVAVLLGTQFYPVLVPLYQQMLVFAGLLFVFFFVLLVFLRYRYQESVPLLGIFMPNIVIVGIIVFATGGITSPFVLLLGLMLVAAGASEKGYLTIWLSILACIVYLAAVYLHAWVEHIHLSAFNITYLLLQISVLLLVGGVMSAIAGRHERARAAEQQAILAHRRLDNLHSRVMEAMHEGVIVADEQLQPVDMNEAARLYLGSSDVSDAVLLERLLDCTDSLKAFLQHPVGMTFQHECDFNGQAILLTVSRLSEEDSWARWLFTLVNISSIRRLERKLADQAKMAALGNMSAMMAHEIRNPIQSIVQGLELFGRVSKERQEEIVSILQNEVQRLNRLVNGMLDYSRPMIPKPAVQDMGRFFEGVLNSLPAEARQRVCLKCTVEYMDVDSSHLRMVVDNLLSNALRQDSSGQPIDVSLYAEGDRWNLRVCDHGGGIADEIREHLFDPFVSGRVDGIGLGLATVLQVCKANQWNIDLEETKTGTCFMVTGIMSKEVING